MTVALISAGYIGSTIGHPAGADRSSALEDCGSYGSTTRNCGRSFSSTLPSSLVSARISFPFLYVAETLRPLIVMKTCTSA